MTAFTIAGGRQAFTSKQVTVLYQQGQNKLYPTENLVLAPSTDTANLTYSAGRLLAVYTEANAPSPQLVGMAVNYDPTSTNADQKICSYVLSDEFANDLMGIDLTTITTATLTTNRVQCAPLLIGAQFMQSAIDNANTSAVITGFNAAFTINVVANVEVFVSGGTGATNDNVITIQANLQ